MLSYLVSSSNPYRCRSILVSNVCPWFVSFVSIVQYHLSAFFSAGARSYVLSSFLHLFLRFFLHVGCSAFAEFLLIVVTAGLPTSCYLQIGQLPKNGLTTVPKIDRDQLLVASVECLFRLLISSLLVQFMFLC